ncbi:MAG: hypothetical protein ABR571_08315 [Jatrophihabitans sp.]|uniref:hypothetical protein n=1 Tax=Jatrophihabitans sp. TaxID=1932789 RepID=UPI0039124E68
MARRGHVLVALGEPGFRRLLAVRLTSQFGDGIFQASLAGAVLFDPDGRRRPPMWRPGSPCCSCRTR